MLKEIEQTPNRVNTIPFFHIVALANISTNFKSKSNSNELIVKVDRIPREITNLSENLPDVFTLSETKELSEYLLSLDQPVKELQIVNIPTAQHRYQQKFDNISNTISHNIPDVPPIVEPIHTKDKNNIPKTLISKSTINPASSKEKFDFSQFKLFIFPILKYGILSLIVTLAGLVGVKKYYESIQMTTNLLMGLFFIASTYFSYKKGGRNILISIILGIAITSLFGIIPIKIMEILYYLYFPAFVNVTGDGSEKTIILNWESYFATGLYGFLLGIFALGFPKVMKKFNNGWWNIFSYITATIIFIVPFINNEALDYWLEKHFTEPKIEKIVILEDQKYIISNLIVNQVYKEDVGQEIIFMNAEDMENYGLKENQIVELIGPTNILSFPVRSNAKTKSGTIRIQKSIRDKLGINVGQVSAIKVTNK